MLDLKSPLHLGNTAQGPDLAFFLLVFEKINFKRLIIFMLENEYHHYFWIVDIIIIIVIDT